MAVGGSACRAVLGRGWGLRGCRLGEASHPGPNYAKQINKLWATATCVIDTSRNIGNTKVSQKTLLFAAVNGRWQLLFCDAACQGTCQG